MYLMSQLWGLLVLAFLLGIAVGYVLWKACGERRSGLKAEAALKRALDERASGASGPAV